MKVSIFLKASKCVGSVQPRVDTLTLDGAPGLAGRHLSGHGCFPYHNPMVAAVTITPLDSGILLVSIPNVLAVVTPFHFLYAYFNGKLGEGA